MSSDLLQKNAEATMQNLRMVNAKLEDNSKLIRAQSAKIATLSGEIQQLQQQVAVLLAKVR